MKLEKDGVLCDCGEFHRFDPYYYAHTHIAIIMECVCGNICVIKNEKIMFEEKAQEQPE